MGLDSVELVMDVEKAFAIEIPDKEAEQIETVGEFYSVVLAKLRAKKKGEVDDKQVWETLRDCIANMGVDPKDIVPEARIVKDLGID